MSRLSWILIWFMLAGCSGGAVVFAPTPLPPDLSALRYDHPSGAFSVNVPRNWPVFAQNTTVLAAASFARPGEGDPSLRFAVLNLGEVVNSAALGDLMDEYQTQIRRDAVRYSETGRQAMGDGSWRLTGVQHSVGGITRQVNTFIEQVDTFLGVIEVYVPDSATDQSEIQRIINSFTIHTDASLQPAEVSMLGFATVSDLDILHIATWSTPAGVFFVTGEVGNYGTHWVSDVPVRALLRTADGLGVVEATDVVMGYGIPPGGFAPFSLRFGQGQSAITTTFELTLGGADWTPQPGQPVLGQEVMTWTDDSSVDSDGRLTIAGTVTNTSGEAIRNVRAVVTVFDTPGNVIAAGFSDVTSVLDANETTLDANETTDFQIIIPEIGGTPVNYLVTMQALP